MLKKKINGKKGFTLAELLIVVAIIAILVVISMPILTSKLNDARKATDDANERAAKSVAVTRFLGEDIESGKTYYYDADNGTLEEANTGIEGYGQFKENKGRIITITMNDAGEVTIDWADAASN